MRKLLEPLIESEALQAVLARPGPVRVDPAGHAYAIAALAEALEGPVLAVTGGPRESAPLAHDVAAYLGADRAAHLPAWEALPVEGISPSPETSARRHAAIRRAREASGPFVLVAPAVAVVQRLLPHVGSVDPLVVQQGEEIEPDELADRLVALGYTRADLVTHRGEFAVRGGIVDVFPGAAPRPVRIELFGDEVESLREFSASTQTSTGRLPRMEADPVRELLPTPEVMERALEAVPRHKDRFRDALDRVSQGLLFEGMEQAGPLIFEDLPLVRDRLPGGAWAVVTAPRLAEERAESTRRECEALADALGWTGAETMAAPGEALEGMTRVDLSDVTEGVDLGIEGWGPSLGDSGRVAGRAASLAGEGYTVAVTAQGHGSLDRAVEVLSSAGVSPDSAISDGPVTGFVFPDGRVAVVGEDDLFGRRRRTHEAPRLAGRSAGAFALELSPGDFVVHRVHGVARYAGMIRRRIGDAERDYLLLEYAKGDRLFVPADQVDVVSKYVGGESPRVHRLGTNDWVRTKARVKRALRDMAGELVRLYSARMAAKGHAFPPDDVWQHELETAFPYEETPDQLTAIDEVKRDMEASRPMDRLLCGDVGYGKTEVALRAAFKAATSGKQVAVLVPTTLLAEQHFVTFAERYAPFPVRVAMLSRFLSAKEQREVLDGLASGEIDVVVGTHRLLGADVRFKDIGLVIVDEEQRFGVAHKERLKQLRLDVDVLTMTATPIPRTLEMALTGIRDMSVVDTPPEDRQPVLTYVGSWEDDVALGAARRELRRGGQVFWVHNDTRTIDRRAGWLAERIPEARIGVAHGQMDEKVLEKTMLAFWNGEVDVLLTTTIIESGLDVPTANTLVIERADALGLAQLYQLRGRVGRSAERAFAYLFFPPQRQLTEEAHARLAAIGRHTALGSGFQIAMRDLEIRGAGNLLGAEQSGHIAAVGFDTYARLLQEAVAELQGEPVPEEAPVRIDLPIKAYLPPDYLGQESLRLDLYREIAGARDEADLDRIRSATEDRFGPLPLEGEALIELTRLRIVCERHGVEEVSTFRGQVRVRPFVPDVEDLPERTAWHAATSTFNLDPPALAGADLARWLRDRLVEASGARTEPAASG
ncbi:MAG TPA: transcription-repair coupling factor [Actinomycetota bacterium]